MSQRRTNPRNDRRDSEPRAVPPTDAAAGVGRRDFLKVAGFTLAGASLACRRGPVQTALPYLEQPEAVVPGRATWYASTCGACTAGCGTLMRCRDGRPVKLEGNPDHPLSRGGLCAVGQASVLSLYDSERLRRPLLEGEPRDWAVVDARVRQGLQEAVDQNPGEARIRLLTETVTSPTETHWIRRFTERHPGARHVTYDPLSSSAILDAHEITHGRRALPRYRFDRAEVILSLDADFLGTWFSPVEHAALYRVGRTLEGEPPRLSHHIQIEARMSLTGSNADRRIPLAPGETGLLLSHLTARLLDRAGQADPRFRDLPEPPLAGETVDELTDRLWGTRGRALVVSGSQRLGEQLLVNRINDLLGGYGDPESEGSVVDLVHPSHQRAGNDRELAELLEEIHAGGVDVLLVRGVNPCYDLPGGAELQEALGRIPLVVSFAAERDETARAATVVAPEPHFLESWRDAAPVAGVVAVAQPAVRPLGQGRTFAESLAAWLGEPAPGRELIRSVWRDEIHPRRKAEEEEATSFDNFWDRALLDGFAEVTEEPEPLPALDPTVVEPVRESRQLAADRLTLVLYPKIALRDGRHAHNPWLQELPDPVSKITWDNYACLAPETAARLGVSEGDVVAIEATGPNGGGNGDAPEPLELPAHLQPGQHQGVVAAALGYGRAGTERFARVGPEWLQGRPTVEPGEQVGVHAAPWAVVENGRRIPVRDEVELDRTGRRHPLAVTQLHHRQQVPGGGERTLAQATTLAAYRRNPSAGARHGHHFEADLWNDHRYPVHHWGMAVDLHACTGCGACVVACQAENNVPVVGRDEVRRQREMHWIRIDRYWERQGEEITALHQPLMCQQCDNAPCETVCPVLATVHSSEGLNQQVYNRCVGTRYCANNCPFKIRRFNWFDYPREDRLANHALNPDVVVRTRGVMEKCSFCVQRIQEAKSRAKVDGRPLGAPLADGEIQPACQQSCPTRALVFGDTNDAASGVRRAASDPRFYRLLTELQVEPSVGYLRRVRHRDDGGGTPRPEGGDHA